MKTPTPLVSCDVCGKPTSRLLGFAAVVSVPAPGVPGEPEAVLTRLRSSARGYCLAHRDQLAPRFLADVEAEGQVVWQAPEPATLRPADLPQFEQDILTMNIQLGHDLGLDSFKPLEPNSDGTFELPTKCPHCAGRLSWGTGPHVGEAAERQGPAQAWECLDCGAAGLVLGMK